MATALKDKISQGLSEVRNVVLGAQVLLGFQYQALFQPRFADLSGTARALEPAAFALLALTVLLLVAILAFHQLAEQGRNSVRQNRCTRTLAGAALAPFGLGLGLDLFIALETEFGGVRAAATGVIGAGLALGLWFGLGLMSGREARRPPPDEKEETVSLKDRITTLLTEARIVLPGVQALLGFQMAAYLTEAFEKLPADARAAHTAALGLLVVAMLLLMAPAPFHRLAERGEDTPRAERVAAGFVVASLAPLGLAIAADLYVALRVVFQSPAVAWAGLAIAAAGSLIAWYALPLALRRPREAGPGNEEAIPTVGIPGGGGAAPRLNHRA